MNRVKEINGYAYLVALLWLPLSFILPLIEGILNPYVFKILLIVAGISMLSVFPIIVYYTCGRRSIIGTIKYIILGLVGFVSFLGCFWSVAYACNNPISEISIYGWLFAITSVVLTLLIVGYWPEAPIKEVVTYEDDYEVKTVWVKDTYYIGPRGGKYKIQNNGRGRIYVGEHVNGGTFEYDLKPIKKKVVNYVEDWDSF
jgi:hypothetical protein